MRFNPFCRRHVNAVAVALGAGPILIAGSKLDGRQELKSFIGGLLGANGDGSSNGLFGDLLSSAASSSDAAALSSSLTIRGPTGTFISSVPTGGTSIPTTVLSSTTKASTTAQVAAITSSSSTQAAKTNSSSSAIAQPQTAPSSYSSTIEVSPSLVAVTQTQAAISDATKTTSIPESSLSSYDSAYLETSPPTATALPDPTTFSTSAVQAAKTEAPSLQVADGLSLTNTTQSNSKNTTSITVSIVVIVVGGIIICTGCYFFARRCVRNRRFGRAESPPSSPGMKTMETKFAPNTEAHGGTVSRNF